MGKEYIYILANLSLNLSVNLIGGPRETADVETARTRGIYFQETVKINSGVKQIDQQGNMF